MRPSDPLSLALDEAIAGRRDRLFAVLTRGSRLPGTRMNLALADAFAQACRTRGARADAVATDMARLSAEEAPGATAGEFLPVCGLMALGMRGGADESARAAIVGELHSHADDLRFRVRDAVVEALARVGAGAGDHLVDAVEPWMDGYFHAAAVVRALVHDAWLPKLHDPARVIARLDQAFVLARDAPRAAARYPGHKALVEALGRTPAAAAIRFGVPVFDMLARWGSVADPSLRDAIALVLSQQKLSGRFGPEVDRVRRALYASLPPPRNPDHDVGPTRDRSGSRKRGRR